MSGTYRNSTRAGPRADMSIIGHLFSSNGKPNNHSGSQSRGNGEKGKDRGERQPSRDRNTIEP